MIARWIVDVLDRELPNLTGAERDRIAEALDEALPTNAIVDAIASSAQAVLTQRNIRDGAGDVAREIANNSAQTVVFALGES
ncbi:MAG: hypothetical protein M3619_00770 [Myxococcota bacterium]|nr:hypothetical protein [Myxococcota bacterium]